MTGKNAATERSHRISLSKRAEFIDLIRGDPARNRLPMSVRAACDKLNISRRVTVNWRRTDPQFSAAYDDAMEDAVDVLEDEATRRAVVGHERPIYQGGELVGTERVYSDRMMELMLVGKRPSVYGRRPEIATQVNVQLEAPSDRDVAKALTLLLEETRQKQVEGTS